MEISWLGHSCFMLRGKNVTLIADPFSPQLGHPQGEPLKLGKVNARPGEYEISDVLITGVASYHDNKRGAERGRNTIYVIHMDDLVICHLGDLGHTLQEEQLEEVADADILLVPISGQYVLNAAQAAEVISQVEPRIVIPMHYHPSAVYQESPGETPNPLDKFCREMGIEAINSQPKLVITHSTLPAETQVVILSNRGAS